MVRVLPPSAAAVAAESRIMTPERRGTAPAVSRRYAQHCDAHRCGVPYGARPDWAKTARVPVSERVRGRRRKLELQLAM
jgi:hypothetical protein